MVRIWRLLFDRPFGCGCGKRFRDSATFSRHVWSHEGFDLKAGVLMARKDV